MIIESVTVRRRPLIFFPSFNSTLTFSSAPIAVTMDQSLETCWPSIGVTLIKNVRVTIVRINALDFISQFLLQVEVGKRGILGGLNALTRIGETDSEIHSS